MKDDFRIIQYECGCKYYISQADLSDTLYVFPNEFALCKKHHVFMMNSYAEARKKNEETILRIEKDIAKAAIDAMTAMGSESEK